MGHSLEEFLHLWPVTQVSIYKGGEKPVLEAKCLLSKDQNELVYNRGNAEVVVHHNGLLEPKITVTHVALDPETKNEHREQRVGSKIKYLVIGTQETNTEDPDTYIFIAHGSSRRNLPQFDAEQFIKEREGRR